MRGSASAGADDEAARVLESSPVFLSLLLSSLGWWGCRTAGRGNAGGVQARDDLVDAPADGLLRQVPLRGILGDDVPAQGPRRRCVRHQGVHHHRLLFGSVENQFRGAGKAPRHGAVHGPATSQREISASALAVCSYGSIMPRT